VSLIRGALGETESERLGEIFATNLSQSHKPQSVSGRAAGVSPCPSRSHTVLGELRPSRWHSKEGPKGQAGFWANQELQMARAVGIRNSLGCSLELILDGASSLIQVK